MRKLAGIVGVAVATVLSACGGNPSGSIDRQGFEDAMVQLRRAESGLDSAAFASRRQAILESLQLTDSMLYAFVAAHSGDPEYMAEGWTAMDERVNGAPEGAGSDTLSHR